MKHVYILTREGKVYSDEGCLTIERGLREYFKLGGSEDIVHTMGGRYNVPADILLELELIEEPDRVVVVSMPDSIGMFYDTAVTAFMRRLKENPGTSSWETASAMYMESDAYKQTAGKKK